MICCKSFLENCQKLFAVGIKLSTSKCDAAAAVVREKTEVLGIIALPGTNLCLSLSVCVGGMRGRVCVCL